ncbi:2-amino-4-hydroxy-6-hydroxymethyldihydropteridine pyrophosphokinase [Nitrincola sp. A-D6]|uniref:2-amino-4-hydroxy-6- hydroxymethyldihydropteridine diphosphokinase n=1 Tax=Nitrincola sp. A-D6 TaxID=1545442 RepID=UPI00051FEEA6|nr:2-amino-4-hydroxy-6-hydroxymethyldihydropteridine diphosphokinase [Nitrincola sp. A-D6]KGK42496.1 2-amino-4-hydroxy-6-hydroxymethyldihydropteridine pyrophosphokinase [Nitrincola sp. A-D6]
MNEVRCFIGLGSNLNEPIQQVRTALTELNSLQGVRLTRHSPLYRSEPVGPAGQPDYINAVAELQTTLHPLALLDALQQVEQKHQRKRIQHWGPRTLDLDLLLYNNETINNERLTVPHPYITKRNFVLRPLADLESDLTLPDGSKLMQHLADCPMGTLQQLPL